MMEKPMLMVCRPFSFIFGLSSTTSVRSPECGFSLLEVLIAVLVVSIGMLGVSAMQLKGLQSSSHSYQRTLASVAAQDAIERLWIELWEDPTSCPAPSSIQSDWTSNWGSLLEGMESSGSTVVADTSEACVYTVTVKWNEERLEDDVANLVYRARLPGGIEP